MELDDAVEQAVSQCIKDGVLANFLLKNRLEAIAVSIFEYDEEKELALLREVEREAGVQQGMQTVVTNMIRRGMSDEDIIAVTECTQELIDQASGCLGFGLAVAQIYEDRKMMQVLFDRRFVS